MQGSGQLGEPALYLCLLVLASTGVAQVKYINAGMALFGNTQVIPVHYVTFTFFSIMARPPLSTVHPGRDPPRSAEIRRD